MHGMCVMFISIQRDEKDITMNDAKLTYQNDTIEALLEPSHGIFLLDAMREPNPCMTLLPLCHTTTRATHHDVEVHTEDTDTRIVPCTEIDVFLNTETKIASIREILAPQL